MRNQPTLTEQILDQLRTAVLNGELKPGIRYSASGLAKQFGVSRTPVREALLELERSGMARIEKNLGVTVVANSLEEIVNCYQLRLLLEVPATARAAQIADDRAIAQIEAKFADMQGAADRDDVETLLRADRDFHSELLAVAQNPRLVTVLEGLRNLVLTTGIATVPRSRSCQELVEDHRDILEAVQGRSPQRAAAAMRRHVHNTATLIIRREAAQRLEHETPGVGTTSPNAAEFEARLFSFEFGDGRSPTPGEAAGSSP
ncbi:GntR family transcriptional regulator [Nesterenkonia muleiensis]|uniref:GntR family transcriptional regulator n=1 Tax=Nesterenkonia muleiensis TaxID=2282648 RepID=UPI0013903E94|nr:GntR family transcriptional regulator [Nesterenkonia muleiensis]